MDSLKDKKSDPKGLNEFIKLQCIKYGIFIPQGNSFA